MLAKVSVGICIFLLIFNSALNATLAGNPGEKSSEKKENISVEIHHCDACGFKSRALELAEELKKEFGIEALLIQGEAGSFDVFVNGELIFSKYEEGRFPNPGEIVQKINEYMNK